MKLKTFYTVPELAEMLGEDRFKVGRMLENMGVVEQAAPGKKRVVWLSKLREKMPDAWASILDKKSLEDQ